MARCLTLNVHVQYKIADKRRPHDRFRGIVQRKRSAAQEATQRMGFAQFIVVRWRPSPRRKCSLRLTAAAPKAEEAPVSDRGNPLKSEPGEESLGGVIAGDDVGVHRADTILLQVG
jgi:hypothetical protein